MNRILTLIVVVTGFIASCFSQNINSLKNEIYLSYGFIPIGHTTTPNISTQTDSYGNNISCLLTNEKKSGTINIGYLHEISNKVSLGFSYTYSSVTGEVHIGSSVALANTDIKTIFCLLMQNTLGCKKTNLVSILALA